MVCCAGWNQKCGVQICVHLQTRHNFSIKNRGEPPKNLKFIILHGWTFYLGPDNSARKKNSSWPFLYQTTCCIFLSIPSFFSLSDSTRYLLFGIDVLTCFLLHNMLDITCLNTWFFPWFADTWYKMRKPQQWLWYCPYFPLSSTGN